MKLKSLLVPVAAAALVAMSGAANATLTVYTSQAAFLAAISTPGVDTYNDLNFTAPLGTPINRTAGTYTYTASAGPISNFFPAGNVASDVWLATNNRTDTITFNNFSTGVQGVGGFFFRSDVNGLSTSTAGTLTISAVDASGTVSQTLTNPGLTTFLGFVSDGAISSVSVWVGTQGTGIAGIWPTVNDLTLGVSAVPEPGTYAMLLAGLAAVGFVARRKKAA